MEAEADLGGGPGIDLGGGPGQISPPPTYGPPTGAIVDVKLEIDQNAIISRDGFNATLKLSNNSGVEITDLQVTISPQDADGEPAGEFFGIAPPKLVGLNAVDGTGSIPVGNSGTASWTIVPTTNAAPLAATKYAIGGTLAYMLNGQQVTIPLFPVPISVLPCPIFTVDYFLEHDVYSDDPFTPQVEPKVPAALGLLVQNKGHGTASDFSITTAQPKIIANSNDLIITFEIIGSQVGTNHSLVPSLTMDLGNIAPQATAQGLWFLTSTLEGSFVSYSASFKHRNDFGNVNTSLIDSVRIHEMNHLVRITSPIDDALADFLVNDSTNVDAMPGIVYSSDGTTFPVTSITNGLTFGAPSAVVSNITFTATVPTGFVYFEVVDPSGGNYSIASVTRSDGTPLLVGPNVWQTPARFHMVPRRLNNLIHIFDQDSTGSYTITFGSRAVGGNLPPTLTPIADQTVAVGSLLTVTNAATDSNVSPVPLVFSFGPGAPTGATIDSGTGLIQWTPNENQAGTNYISVVVSDDGSPALTATQSFAVKVIVTPPTITSQPLSTNLNLGQTATFSVAATGSPVLRYAWTRNGSPLSDGAGLVGSASNRLTVSNLLGVNAGSYAVLVSNLGGSVLSSDALLTLTGHPFITNQPAGTNVNSGSSATFVVGATGTAPLAYQWVTHGTNIPGATRNQLKLTGVLPSFEGEYSVIVSNIAGTTLSSGALLTVNTKPVIVLQPASLAVNSGSNATFSVGVTGTSPFAYQWLLNGTNLAGATDSSFTFQADGSFAGSYTAVISNVAGTVTSFSAKLSLNQMPTFTKFAADHTNLVGTANTFTALATGTAPLGYQWQFNGVNLAGATTNSLTVSNLVVANGGQYSLIASNVAGLATNSALLTMALDIIPPTLTITTPTNGQHVVVNSFLATGTAADNAQVTNVIYRLNGGAWLSASTTNAWKNWSATLDGQLTAGTNALAVMAQDFSGNMSVSSSKTVRSFFFEVPSILTVRTNGSGTVSTNLDQQTLFVGQNYSLTAVPGPGWVFTNWLVGSVLYSNAALTFTMQTNLQITANFVPSPFAANVVGNYSGLFFETNVVAFPSSGLLSLTVDTNGLFNASVYLAGVKLSAVSQLFAPSGQADFVLARTAQHLPGLQVSLFLDLTGGSHSVTGLVSSVDGAWTAPFWSARADFSATEPTALAGKYTFAIPGSVDPALGPVGNGYGAVTVNSNGTVVLAGNLGDGTKQAQALTSVSISPSGMWPLYEPLYRGGGALIGWISISNSPGVITNLSGSVFWTKLANVTNAFFPGGFTNQSELTGSGYVPPAAGRSVLDLPISSLTLAGADLAAPISNLLSLTPPNLVQFGAPNPYNIKLTITSSSGLFTGSFLNPITGLTNIFGGVLLQNQNLGAGEFISTNSAGSLLIH